MTPRLEGSPAWTLGLDHVIFANKLIQTLDATDVDAGSQDVTVGTHRAKGASQLRWPASMATADALALLQDIAKFLNQESVSRVQWSKEFTYPHPDSQALLHILHPQTSADSLLVSRQGSWKRS